MCRHGGDQRAAETAIESEAVQRCRGLLSNGGGRAAGSLNSTVPCAPPASAAPAPSVPLISAAAVAAVAVGVSTVPMLLPAAAAASSSMLATIVPRSVPPPTHWSDTLLWCYTAAGAASLLVSLVCTSRFLVSL